MRRLTFCMLIFLAACNTTPSIPENILPPQKMQSVLWDLLEADELTNYQVTMDTTIKSFKKSAGLYKSIYRMHGITEDQFQNSFRFYEANPVLLKPIIDSLQKKANRIITTPT